MNDEETADFVGRVYNEESNLSTFVFENSDGSHTMKVYSHPVKYEDEDGKIKDIALDLIAEPDGSFVSAGNNIVSTFGRNLTDGIETVYSDLRIKIIPVIPEEFRDSSIVYYNEEDNKLTYQIDEMTEYQYSLTYTGYKEDIIVDSYTGQTEYSFLMYTNGLSLDENEGFWYLSDDKGNLCINFGDVVVYSADGRNNTLGYMSSQTVRENEEYIITIHLDEYYLSSDLTLYPIRIDPTIVINNGTNNIHTTTLKSNGGSPQGIASGIRIGNESGYIIERALLSFPIYDPISQTGLDLSPIHSSLNVQSARVELYDVLQQSEVMYVNCFQFNRDWDPITATWNSMGQNSNSDIYTHLDSQKICYSEGINQTVQHRYKFNIKLAVQRWVDTKDLSQSTTYNTFRSSRGLILKANNGIENGSTERYKNFATCYAASNRPSLTIKYTVGIQNGTLYSKYDPEKYNVAPVSDPNTNQDIFNYRTSCYGYSVGLVYNGESCQQSGDNWPTPGAYSSNALPLTGSTLSEYTYRVVENTFSDGNNCYFNGESSLDDIVTDPGFPNNITTIPQFGSESRLILVVTVSGYFHYYMQHSDGTWSSKNGNGPITNTSFTSYRLLTNDNILQYMNEVFSSNVLKQFFLIKKPFEYWPSMPTNYPAYLQLPRLFSLTNNTGDYLENSKQIIPITNNDTPYTFQIDHSRDEDVFWVVPSFTGNYTISVGNGNNTSMKITLYNINGTEIISSNNSTNPSITVGLYAGDKYFVKFYNPDYYEYGSSCGFNDYPDSYTVFFTRNGE